MAYGLERSGALLLIVQFVFAVLCSRYVEKLGIVAAAVLLFAYTAFSTLEFSLILTPRLLTLLFVCAGLMYAVTAAAGYSLASTWPRRWPPSA